jgi:hypothetical protein
MSKTPRLARFCRAESPATLVVGDSVAGDALVLASPCFVEQSTVPSPSGSDIFTPRDEGAMGDSIHSCFVVATPSSHYSRS